MIVVNGEPRLHQQGSNVSDLLLDMGLDPNGVVVQVGGGLVPHDAYGSTPIDDGDVVEVTEIQGAKE